MRMTWRAVVAICIGLLYTSCDGVPLSRKPESSVFEKRQRCAELGWQYYERFKRQSFNQSGVVLPEFGYNAERDTCLATVGINFPNPVEGRGPILHRKIVDILANVTRSEFRNEIAPPAFTEEFEALMGYRYANAALDPELFRQP